MAKKNLREKAAAGMIWTTIQKFTLMGVHFISGIILARLLNPYDFGCIGMLTIFMTLTEAFIDGGFGSALIQKKRPTQTDYSTIFWWNLALSFVMYAVLYVSAPAISRFYHIDILCDVLRVQGIILFIYALNLIQRNQLKKQLKFKIIAIVRIITCIIQLTVTIIMAYKGYGVWALVANNIISGLIPAIVFWIYSKWQPSWVFSWKSFKELFSFGFYMFLTYLMNRFFSQIQGLLIGRIYNPSTLGYYSKAMGTERLASGTITGVMTSVTYPLYAEVQDNMEKMQNMIKRLTSTISFINFPLLILLLLEAKAIFVLLYSEKWLPSVPYFQMLCIAGMGGCLTSVNTQCIAAIGKSKVMFKWTLIKRIIGFSCIIGGLVLFGMKGLLAGIIFNSWFSYFVNIMLVSVHIGYKWTRQIWDLLQIILVTVIFGVATYLSVNAMGLSLYLDGIVKFFLFSSLYVLWFLLLKPESYLYTKGIITPLIEKYIKKRK